MRKIDLKLIVLQALALIFLIAGVQRLYVAFQADKYKAIWSDGENFQSLYSITVGELFLYQELWSLAAFLIGIAILTLLNKKRGIPVLNAISVFVLVLILYLIGFFSGGKIKLAIDAFWESMALDYQATYFIAGIFLFAIGFTIAIKSLRLNREKSTIHNNI